MIVGMDWLTKYKVILNCFDKTFTYVVEDQNVTKVEGVIKPISLRKISTLQLERCMGKGCKLCVVRVAEILLNEGQTQVKDHPILSNFMDVFSKEIPELPRQ